MFITKPGQKNGFLVFFQSYSKSTILYVE